MPLTAKGLRETRVALRRVTKSRIRELGPKATGGPTRVLEPPFKFPPTKSENPRAQAISKKFADLLAELLVKD